MRDQHCIIQVNNSTDWVAAAAVKNHLDELPQPRSVEWEKQSIYKIPWSMMELCSRAYRPQTVSIGPYHHGESHLDSMEEHKQRALLTFLKRSGHSLKYYMDALAPVVGDLKEAYRQLQPKWKQDGDHDQAFLLLMILDGCFILEIMRTATIATTEALTKMGYDLSDPVFSNHGKLCFVPYIKRDMLMLENQIPLLVLLKLVFAEGNLTVDDLTMQDELTALILKFFSQTHDAKNNKEFKKCLHILDMYRRSLLMILPCQKSKAKERICDCLPGPGSLNKEDVYARSATELKEAGIQFKQSETRNINDITFKGGVLKLPVITVDDALESEYLNLMAWERFHAGAGKEVTSYVFFMDSIIDSARDVSLLHSSGIIHNALGSDKAVANLFNSLSRDVSIDDNGSLGLVHRQVSDYCRTLWPRWVAYAKHNYFTNPWVGLSIVAAIFLFALTGIQTAYTVLGYYKPTK